MVSPHSATPIDGRVLIFDADGVLIQPWGFANVLQHSYGISRNVTHSFFSGPFQACLKGKAALEDVLPPYLDGWGWTGSTGQFIELWLDADNNPAVHVFRAIDAVRRPKDVCCVASNQERRRAEYIANDMKFSSCFDRLYFSCTLGSIKPEADFYRKVQDDLGVSPTQIRFWDDSRQHVNSALALGWNACLFDGPASIR